MQEKKDNSIKAFSASTGASQDLPGDHPITNHQSFSHSVLNAGANQWREAVGPILHGRSHRDPTMKPHEHSNHDPNWHLARGAHLR